MKDMLVQLSIALGLTVCFGMIAYLLITMPLSSSMKRYEATQSVPDTTPDRIREAEWETDAASCLDISDTEAQTEITCLAVGAHDALRWALGLAERSISETLDDETTA